MIRNFVLWSLLLLSGCATSYLGISVSPGQQASAVKVTTFEVQPDKLPAFLGPILVSNFSVALAERGLQPVASDGDAVVFLRYVQEDLTIEQDHDAFDERIDQGSDTRFVAKVEVEINAASTGERIWAGSIQRLHTIRPGDYMHTGNASVALLEAFRDLLSDYPDQNL